MKAEAIPYHQTKHFSQFILKYISGDTSLRALYNRTPSIESFKAQITEKKSQNFNRNALVTSLVDQYSGIDSSDLVKNNIQSIAQENTFTVATGHQLCLFMGPLYFMYKIISTLNLSEKLKESYPEYNFVPIFWMATEDNDFEEVNHVHLFGNKLTWNQTQKGGVGEIETYSLKSTLDQLKSILGDSKEAKELYHLFSSAYLQHNNLAEATRYLVNSLFSKYGLVVLDANTKSLKQEAISLIKADVLRQENYPLIKQTNKALPKSQAYVRPINFFYQLKGFRNRIELNGDVYVVLNSDKKFSKKELELEIENYPERFSPNVLMRPLFKELILPNLATIGGSAEISYWMQLKSSFAANGIVFPILFLRNSALVIESKLASKITHLNLSSHELFEDEHLLHKSYVTKNTTDEISVEEQRIQSTVLFEQLLSKTQDASLTKSIKAEQQKQLNTIDKIEQKLLKSEKQKHQIKLAQITLVKNKLFPNNGLQERYDSIIPFYLTYGSSFIDRMKSHLNPFEFNFTVVQEK